MNSVFVFTVLFVFPFKQKTWDLDDIEDASEKIWTIAREVQSVVMWGIQFSWHNRKAQAAN